MKAENKTMSGLYPSRFEERIDDVPCRLISLRNAEGLEVCLTNYGARIVSVLAPDSEGLFDDVVLGFDNIDDYRGPMDQAFGAVIGRYANRIGGAKFILQGKEYHLEQNEGNNTLHSGSASWMHRPWEVLSSSESAVTMEIRSKDGEGGFPGNVDARVTYQLHSNNALTINYEAITDAPTPLNLTNHAYFNLNGHDSGTIDNHVVEIRAGAYTPVDKAKIPTGEIRSVTGSPFDLRIPCRLDDRLRNGILDAGYDHNFVLSASDSESLFNARVCSPKTGREVRVSTDLPGMQFYTGDGLGEQVINGKHGAVYEVRAGLCLEAQEFPDAPNRSAFPEAICYPGVPYRARCVYRFGLVQPSVASSPKR